MLVELYGALLFSACPSVCLSVVTLTHSFLIRFKFKYRFCPTSDNQDGRQNGPHISISAVVVTLTQSFLIGFLPNFIYGLLPSTSRSSLNKGFVPLPITKMADKMAATYQFYAVVVTLTQSFFNQISSKFHT